MTKIKICELVFDMTIYPRHDVDRHHVNDIARSMEAGCDMPPIVVEKKTRRIIDGFHRGKAYLKNNPPEFEIEVVEKTYKDEKALFLDAIRYNSSHGKNFDSHDRAHCVIMAARLQIDDESIANVLHVDQKYIGSLRVDRTAFAGKLSVDTGKPTRKPGEQIPLKQTIKHMAGQTLTKGQEDANTRLSGMNQVFYVNQVILLIENGLLDKENDALFERLKVLHGSLEGLLVA